MIKYVAEGLDVAANPPELSAYHAHYHYNYIDADTGHSHKTTYMYGVVLGHDVDGLLT